MQSQPSPKAKMQNLQASLMEIFEHGMALEHYLERGRGYRVFVLQYRPIIGHWFPQKKKLWMLGIREMAQSVKLPAGQARRPHFKSQANTLNTHTQLGAEACFCHPSPRELGTCESLELTC